ncbi:hypothetical protein KXD40_007924 [Peronospora effusa]|nr:hypothetical protein KXD40_007924 [Peronospora effusa]
MATSRSSSESRNQTSGSRSHVRQLRGRSKSPNRRHESKRKSRFRSRSSSSEKSVYKKQKKHSKKRHTKLKKEEKQKKKAVDDIVSAIPFKVEEGGTLEEFLVETTPVDAKSFFEQLQKQEAAKKPVGTVHSRGLPTPISATTISTSDKWECSKAGCGHMNFKHAPACNNLSNLMSESQILRTGVLFKKGSGAGPFGRKNWKPRYFVLTPSRLQYFTFEDGECKGELSLQGCDEGVLEVMPADSMKTGSSASTIWRVAINAPERRLLVAAGTEMEMNDWVDKLVMAFRINSGQPSMQRASMPAPSSATSNTVNSNPSIRDFRNFSVPRRGMNQRHSIGGDIHSSNGHAQDFLQVQVENLKQLQLEEQRGQDEVEEDRLEQLRQKQQLEETQAEQDDEMRRQLPTQQQRKMEEIAAREMEKTVGREQEDAAAREMEEAAFAAAEELQRQEKLEKLAQMERKLQKQKEMQRQQALELQRAREEEAARSQHEQEQEVIRNKTLTDELVLQETLKPQQGDDLLEMQRRQKREKHAYQRAERQKAIKLQLEQEKDAQELALRVSRPMNSRFSDDGGLDDSDNEPERSSLPRGSGGGGLKGDGAARLSASQASATAPRSSLVGDVKREMIHKQQIEHQRRREAALMQQQQTRDAEWRERRVEVEQQRVRMEATNVREAPREVEVAPREIEVVRRAPVKKPAPATAPMESLEF